MGVIEQLLLEYYRRMNKENYGSLSLQEVEEWIWLEFKCGMEKEEYRIAQIKIGRT